MIDGNLTMFTTDEPGTRSRSVSLAGRSDDLTEVDDRSHKGAAHTADRNVDVRGEEVVQRVRGTDADEWLGASFVVHRVEVTMSDADVYQPEMIGPYDAQQAAVRTCAYDGVNGEIDRSTATVADTAPGRSAPAPASPAPSRNYPSPTTAGPWTGPGRAPRTTARPGLPGCACTGLVSATRRPFFPTSRMRILCGTVSRDDGTDVRKCRKVVPPTPTGHI